MPSISTLTDRFGHEPRVTVLSSTYMGDAKSPQHCLLIWPCHELAAVLMVLNTWTDTVSPSNRAMATKSNSEGQPVFKNVSLTKRMISRLESFAIKGQAV